MTKNELKACETLCEKALKNISKAEDEYREADRLRREGGDFETQMRKADRHFGEAEGIQLVLSALKYKSDKMKSLSEEVQEGI